MQNEQKTPEIPGLSEGSVAKVLLDAVKAAGAPADVVGFVEGVAAFVEAKEIARQAQQDRIETMLIQICLLEGLEIPGGAVPRSKLN